MDLKDGEIAEVQGSAKLPYKIKNIGGVYSCSCIAWKMQSQPIDKRTCRHIRKLRGDEAESARLGGSVTMKGAPTKNKTTAVPPSLLLAEKYSPDMDPTGWWMSEKLDGVRAYWNSKELLSRLGNKFYAPEWFTKGLPKSTQLDGELFIDRKKFQETVSIVRRQDMPETWKKVKYLVFDLPASKHCFEERYNQLWDIKRNGILPEYVVVVNQTRCQGAKDLKDRLAEVEKIGGEGIMLRESGSFYEGNRSCTLLKVKSFLDDEAIIVGHEPGKGRHKGRLGALVLEWNQKRFNAGTGLSDAERNNPPVIGQKVTFAYQELSTDGIPRFPVYKGLVIDK
jgi:DNA ligase-1